MTTCERENWWFVFSVVNALGLLLAFLAFTHFAAEPRPPSSPPAAVRPPVGSG